MSVIMLTPLLLQGDLPKETDMIERRKLLMGEIRDLDREQAVRVFGEKFVTRIECDEGSGATGGYEVDDDLAYACFEGQYWDNDAICTSLHVDYAPWTREEWYAQTDGSELDWTPEEYWVEYCVMTPAGAGKLIKILAKMYGSEDAELRLDDDIWTPIGEFLEKDEVWETKVATPWDPTVATTYVAWFHLYPLGDAQWAAAETGNDGLVIRLFDHEEDARKWLAAKMEAAQGLVDEMMYREKRREAGDEDGVL